MAMLSLYLTHPEVIIDPLLPIGEWRLSAKGRARAKVFAHRKLLPIEARIISSTERKAIETAEILAAVAGAAVEPHAEFGENDRSATGYLPAEEFEAQVERLFADPEASAGGWETALAAQARIVAAVAAALAGQAGPVVFVGHGCVGTLLKCNIGRRAIARSEDQPEGGGNCFVFDFAGGSLRSDWQALEDFPGLP